MALDALPANADLALLRCRWQGARPILQQLLQAIYSADNPSVGTRPSSAPKHQLQPPGGPRLLTPPEETLAESGASLDSVYEEQQSELEECSLNLSTIRMALAIPAWLLAAGNAGLLTILLRPGGDCIGLAWRLLKLASTLTLHPQGVRTS